MEAQKQLEYRLLLQADRISSSVRKPDYNLPIPFNPVDEDIIRDYNEQFKEGKINYAKEILDETPELDEPNLKPLQPLPDVNREVNELLRLKRELKNTEKAIEDETQKINNGSRQSIQTVKQLKIKRTKLISDIDYLSTIIITQESLKKQNQDIELENLGNIKRVQKSNQEKINAYKEKIYYLSKGVFSTEQLPSETEEQYLKRLRDNVEYFQAETLKDDAEFRILKRFRESLKELIRDAVLIDQVSNYFDYRTKYQIVKRWNDFKKKFIDIYGVFNSHLNIDDFVEFIEMYLSSGGVLNEGTSYVGTENIPIIPSNKKIEIIPFPEDKMVQLFNNQTRKSVFLIAILERGIRGGEKFNLLYSFTGSKGSFKTFDGIRNGMDIITKETGITSNDFIELFGTDRDGSLIAKSYYSKFKIPVITEDFTTTETITNRGTPKKTYGYGLSIDHIPEYQTFGKVLVLLKKLYLHNILAVKHHNKINIAGFKNTRVSDRFVNIIMEMCEGKHPTHNEINALSSTEKLLYDRLITLAGLNKIVAHNGEKTITELKKRLKLLEGEINIGNNNPEIKKEIYYILHTLKDFKSITPSQIKSYLQQI
jgi:hypothetical protein